MSLLGLEQEKVVGQPASQTELLPRSTSHTAVCILHIKIKISYINNQVSRQFLGCLGASPTFAQKHLRGNVVWSAHQRVCQASLVLTGRPLLQSHEPVTTTTVRYIIPKVTWFHTILPDMVPYI